MIHEQTHIHPNAKLGSDVSVDPFSVIHDNVQIGDSTWIGSNVTIMSGARIGSHCRVFPGAVIAAIPQDLKFDGEDSTVEIGNNTTIREFVTIHRGTKDKWVTRVGNDCLIMAYSHIAHDCNIGNHCILGNCAQVAGHAVIEDYAILGGMTGLHQFVKIGTHAFIGGGSVAFKDVPPYVKAAGNPILYAGINSEGLKRRGFPPEKINAILNIYRYLYVKGNNTSQALDLIEREVPETEERNLILKFIHESGRGIIKRRQNRGDSDED
ncbi:MAG TPA: acyl-ACP--UDP-N-acetylglucosamine O-acyltransferase [Chitinophagaceae bacterium]|nr:acyl-ACP--UDP-N-acetylglucosamine O-acyltransferase [Chitinophagaceae bacterium]